MRTSRKEGIKIMYFRPPKNYYLVWTARLDYIASMIEIEYRYVPSVNTVRVIRDIIPLAVQFHISKLSKNRLNVEAAINAIKSTELIGMTFNDIMSHVILIERIIINSRYLNFTSLALRYRNPDTFIFDFDDSDCAKVFYIYEYIES